MIPGRKLSQRRPVLVASVIFMYCMVRSCFPPLGEVLVHKGDPYGKWFGVEYVETARIKSPSENIDIIVTEVFRTGLINILEMSHAIIMQKSGNQSSNEVIYEIESEDNYSNRPEVIWLSGNAVLIKVENYEKIWKRVRVYNGINVKLEFINDNPSERLENIKRRYSKEAINDQLLDMYDIPDSLRQNMPLPEGKCE